MYKFIVELQHRKLLTDFLKIIFDYRVLNDYNYIFRIIMEDDRVIIDIYDNVSENRFNRYVFIFKKGKYKIKCLECNNVYITYINVLNSVNDVVNVYRLAYLFRLDKSEMIEYAKTFLDYKFIKILIEIIK